jgi:signal transduction histidine kinase
MFEPFFSTKGSGGAGLGLWICDQLIARNGGSLRVRSSQGPGSSGTVFVLFLPDSV